MAATRSRLHTLLQTCNRCAGKSSSTAVLFDHQRRTASELHFPLFRRYSSVTERTRWSSSHVESSTAKTIQDPYHLVEKEMSTLCDSIRQELSINQGDLGTITRYYFDGTGKAFRPMVVLLMAKACNFHHQANDAILESQRKIAMITEMLHTATLIHDDVIDASDARRGKESINYVWGQRKAILAGDYILSVLSSILARIGNPEVVSIMSQVVEDLVRGEFMQLGSKEDENERFRHYLDKTFKKTASMLAASCKSVAVLGECEEDISDLAYQYGRNLGISFQLVDDLLDFVSSEQQMGKPTAADLRLGLATAPVLFAAQQFPELNPLIMRRFSEEGDVETARYLVSKSDGIEQTKYLASEHTREAIRLLQQLSACDFQNALTSLTHKLLQRQK
ncbi:hypothetical protein BaRGS_00027788 [Batillaria attramentaria]|uniref:All trans-polyprenyl-diphosphate synthase PDSS1 n=1 Tax=Batillaria attramentaria TaxID=370345 RepID=A0ABD0K294_9CAEN